MLTSNPIQPRAICAATLGSHLTPAVLPEDRAGEPSLPGLSLQALQDSETLGKLSTAIPKIIPHGAAISPFANGPKKIKEILSGGEEIPGFTDKHPMECSRSATFQAAAGSPGVCQSNQLIARASFLLD